MLDYGYNTYTLRQVVKKASAIQTIDIKNATRDTKKIELVLAKDVSVLIKKDNLYDVLLPVIKLNKNIKAPIKSGDILGAVSYKVEGITYTYDLISNQDVKVSKFFINILIIIFIYIIFKLYIKNKNINKKNRRLKKKIK